MMQCRRWLFAIVLVGCKRQEPDTMITFTATTDSAAPSPSALVTASASASASVAPLASAASSARDAAAERAALLNKQAEQMQIQMLQALDSRPTIQGALTRSDVPMVDLSSAAVSTPDGGRSGGSLRLGGGSRGGLGELRTGERDH